MLYEEFSACPALLRETTCIIRIMITMHTGEAGCARYPEGVADQSPGLAERPPWVTGITHAHQP
jgi:hypothetical protein